MISSVVSFPSFAGATLSGVDPAMISSQMTVPGQGNAETTEDAVETQMTKNDSTFSSVGISGEPLGTDKKEVSTSFSDPGEAIQDSTTVQEEKRVIDVNNLNAEDISALADYFKDSVIIGDSIAENFQRYNLSIGAGDVVSDNFTSLAVAGYSISKALLPNNGSNIHPMLQGKRYRLPEAVSIIGAKHVYSFFGYKDLADVYAADKYELLLKEIQTTNPETDITVISTTYMTEGNQDAEYNNSKVRTLNENMRLKCEANGWSFIDVQDIMSDGRGNLPDEWSIDKKIHYNYPYYIYWVNEMKRFALEKLNV